MRQAISILHTSKLALLALAMMLPSTAFSKNLPKSVMVAVDACAEGPFDQSSLEAALFNVGWTRVEKETRATTANKMDIPVRILASNFIAQDLNLHDLQFTFTNGLFMAASSIGDPELNASRGFANGDYKFATFSKDDVVQMCVLADSKGDTLTKFNSEHLLTVGRFGSEVNSLILGFYKKKSGLTLSHIFKETLREHVKTMTFGKRHLEYMKTLERSGMPVPKISVEQLVTQNLHVLDQLYSTTLSIRPEHGLSPQ